MSVLIVAAVKFEVLPLLEELEKKGVPFEFAEIGIGAINAARSFDRLRTLASEKDVVYVGTCGVFGNFTDPYLVCANRAIWSPPCHRSSLSWCIEGLDEPFDLPKPQNWANSLTKASVLCSPTISKSPEIQPDAAAQLGIKPAELLVENLELYSCGQAFIESAKSLTVIMGVTNAVGLEGRKQWKQNFKRLAAMTSDFIVQGLT